MIDESVFDNVIEIVEWYKELPADYIDISELMHCRKRLATYGVTFGVEVGSARGDWKILLAKYEAIKNQKRLIYSIKQGTTKGNWSARANCETELELATLAENIFWKMDYTFRSIREVLGEMNQRISYLREEMKQDRFYANS